MAACQHNYYYDDDSIMLQSMLRGSVTITRQQAICSNHACASASQHANTLSMYEDSSRTMLLAQTYIHKDRQTDRQPVPCQVLCQSTGCQAGYPGL